MTPDLAWWGRLAAFLAAQTALVVGVAAIVNYKIRAPQARCAVWQAALLALLCVWLGESAGLGDKWRGLWPREEIRTNLGASQFINVTGQADGASVPAGPPPEVHRAEPMAPVTWPGKVWLLGTLLLLLRAAANRGRLAWQRRGMALADGETQEAVARLRAALGLGGVEARTWARLRGPIAFGWRRPTVALPRGFSLRFTPAQREAMLAHELAHLAARDPLWLALADMVCALAWWNPPAWWAAAQLRAASEAAADEASALVPAGPAALAESLLRFGREIAESGPARGLGVAGNGFRSSLGRRVKALLTTPLAWRELPAVWRWSPRIFGAIFVVALTSLPVMNAPSGSVVGLLVSSARAESSSQKENPRKAGNQPRDVTVPQPAAPEKTGDVATVSDLDQTVTDSHDSSFSNYFGGTGIKAVDSALTVLNTVERSGGTFGDVNGANSGKGADASVHLEALDPSGNVIIGGEFVPFNATNTVRMARLLPDGSLDTTFNPGVGPDNSVRTLSNGEVIVTWPTNRPPARKVVVLQANMASIPEGSPGQITMDKLFGQLPPDEAPGLELLAQYLHESKISHTENFRADYHLTKDEVSTLTPEQFKAAIETLEQQSGCDMITLPKTTSRSGGDNRIEVAEVPGIVTAVAETNHFVVEPLTNGILARIRATASPDGWSLSIMSRQSAFLGYDRPYDLEKNKTVTPLPHLRISEIRGAGTVRTGETLALRGPAISETHKIKTSVLGIFHRTRIETVRNRLYLFVRVVSETN